VARADEIHRQIIDIREETWSVENPPLPTPIAEEGLIGSFSKKETAPPIGFPSLTQEMVSLEEKQVGRSLTMI